jgi:hypothetical protein
MARSVTEPGLPLVVEGNKVGTPFHAEGAIELNQDLKAEVGDRE